MLVGSSKEYLTTLSEALADQHNIEIVCVTEGGSQTAGLVRQLRPQVICAELESPAMSGLRLAEEVMAQNPTPILILTPEGVSLTPELLSRVHHSGALEMSARPNVLQGPTIEALRSKIRVLAGVKVFGRRAPLEAKSVEPVATTVEPKIVAIGASTGGPQALSVLLGGLSANFPWPIVCAQHMTSGFLENLVAWLDGRTELGVVRARSGDRLQAGKVYFAPENQHLKVKSDFTVALDHGPTVDGHRPSVTVLFESVARAFGPAALGVLLTGMGVDGASGLLALRQAGAMTMVQDQASSVVYGMAQRAVELGAARRVLSLEELKQQLRVSAERRTP